MSDWKKDVAGVEVVEPDPEVKKALKKGKHGPIASIDNLVLILTLDPVYQNRAFYDEFFRRVMWDDQPIEDQVETAVNVDIAKRYDIFTASAKVGEAIRHVAHQRPRHPVCEYLDGLAWDGTPRTETWLIDHMGADDTGYMRAVSRCFLVSAVARVRNPGCKVDTMPVLHGPQGIGKSRAIRGLAGDPWFSDSDIDFGSKDAYQSLPGVWLYELSELESLRRSEATSVKAFLSAQVDHYRPSYGRNTVDVPRQNVFVGTTNDEEFLRDPTGSRRFWPVSVRRVDYDALMSVRDQLWAEAQHRYAAGERWWLDDESEIARIEASERHHGTDPWEDVIGRWVRRQSGPFTIAEVLAGAIEKEPAHQERRDAMRAADIVGRLGYIKRRTRVNGDRTPRWWHPDGIVVAVEQD